MAVLIESRGEPLPGYRLIERLGRGGFGEVWKVEAPGGLPKAIKFVYNHDLPGEQRGLGAQELKALNRVKRVRHPYILSLERFDIVDDCLLIVMELADRNLADRYRECKEQGLIGIPRDELLDYMEETAEALDLMNQTYDLQHLDIKPQNLFLVHKHVKVGDFGLVKDLEGLVAPVTGGVTPVYAAPETFEGWISRFCDQYSLAIVYQELLTGLRPFRGANARQLLVQHLQGAPDLSPLPASDRDAINRALAKDPNQRHASCADLIRALREASVPPPVPARVSGDSVSNFTPESDTLNDSRRRALLAPAPPTPAPIPTLAGEAVLGKRDTAPPEQTGNGSLFPTLVIGLGNQGLQVLRSFRYELAERFAPESLRQLRLLFLDTDLEAIHAAYDGPSMPLQPEQTFLVKLQRPGYYLRPREWQVPYESWMPAQTLFRMTRNQTTAGIRCLGRLAFCDHYRAIAGRLREELDACLEPEALAAAAEQTKLGIRSNRPRVYVVTSLGGGTGGGMFIDLAYLLRALLKQKGYDQPDVVGVLLLPSLGSESSLASGLGNAYAALTELHYFSQPDSTFTARYHPKDAPFRDNEAPFDRCLLVPQPESKSGELGERLGQRALSLTGLPAAFLVRDLLTPLGRAADSSRSGAAPSKRKKPLLSTFGLYRFAFPRGELIGEATRRLCHQLVDHWLVKGTARIRDNVARWLEGQMPELQLDTQTLLSRLRTAAEPAGQPTSAESIRAILDRFAADHSGMNVTAADILQTLDQLSYIVGKPKDEGATPSAALAIALSQVTPGLAQEYEQKLNELSVSLVDRPGFRFSAAEEFIAQTTTLLERLVQQVEVVAKRLAREATEACAQILTLAEGLEKSRVWSKLKLVGGRRLNHLLEIYARSRHDCLLLQSAAAIYQTVLSGRPQFLREIGFYRHRVGELLSTFGDGLDEPFEPVMAHGRYVYAGDSRTFAEAVNQFVAGVTADDLLQLDQLIQEAITAKFKSLVQFCLSVAHGVTELELAIYEKAMAFLEPRLPARDIAEACLRPGVSDAALRADVAEAYAQSVAPVFDDPSQGSEFCIAAMPPSRFGEQFRKLAAQALPDVRPTIVPSSEEVVFYRERVGVALTDLPQLGKQAHQAYSQMAALDNLTPHSRTDVDWFAPGACTARTVRMVNPV